MAIKIPGKGTAVVSKEDKVKGKTIAEEHVEEHVDTPMAEDKTENALCDVGMEMSFTKNMGNYESTRVAVSLKVPCQIEQLDEAFEYVNTWLEAKMQALVDELNA